MAVNGLWIDPDPQRMPLGRLLAWTGQSVTAYYRRAVSAHGLSATALGALGVLAADDPLSHRELAGRLGVTPATLTPVIDAMAAAGIVRRERDPDDRRVVRVWITPAGRERLAAATAEVERLLAERLPQPPARQHRAVRDYLLAVLAAVDDES